MFYFFVSIVLAGELSRLKSVGAAAGAAVEGERGVPEQTPFQRVQRAVLNSAIILLSASPVLILINSERREFGLLLLLFLFLTAYLRESFSVAALWLGMAAAAKFYPAILGVLFLIERRTRKHFFAVLMYLVLFNLFALLQFKGSFWQNLEAFLDLVNSTIRRANLLSLVTMVGAFGVFAYFSVGKYSGLWRRVTLLTIGMILCDFGSLDQRMILLFLPIPLLLIAERESSRNVSAFLVLFGLLIIPRNYFDVPGYWIVYDNINFVLMAVLASSLFILGESAPTRSSTDSTGTQLGVA